MTRILRIRIEGYKSFETCDVRLERMNVLIGPNGGGKSNFIEFFNLIDNLLGGNLQNYIAAAGGAGDIFRFADLGSERRIRSVISFAAEREYHFSLVPDENGTVRFADESLRIGGGELVRLGCGHLEAKIGDFDTVVSEVICKAYRFRNMGSFAQLRSPVSIDCGEFLRGDGGNLAAYLYNIKTNFNHDYIPIVKRLRIIAPFFEDFCLEPDEDGLVSLRWFERSCGRIPLSPRRLSDGTLRFACLLAALRHPKTHRPDVFLIDDPELNVHPSALDLIYHTLKVVSKYRQVIVTTQSAPFLDKFSPSDVVVADRRGGCTSLSRLDLDEIEEWLTNRRLSEIWERSIIGGQPVM
ncbi:chromosome segregation protein SMC [Synergistales bacterium]|nr:chromosome segregation protein SMC [Synergistales bacterium]